MKYKIAPEIKRLYASLLKIKIENFLITDNFEQICLEHDVDGLWDEIDSFITSESGVAILIPGYTGYAKDALPLFLSELSKDTERFLKILIAILEGFSKWSRESIDFTEVKERLLEVGFEEKKLDKSKIFSPLKVKKEVKEVKEKIPFFKKVFYAEKIEGLCFVLMPFGENFDSIYDDAIKPAIESCGLNCLRADDIFSTRPIIEDIWGSIQKSKILIADLTGRNPNVFYEVGLSHAIGREVILLTQSKDDVPFNLRHYRYILYQDSVAGGKKLKEGIINTIKNTLDE